VWCDAERRGRFALKEDSSKDKGQLSELAFSVSWALRQRRRKVFRMARARSGVEGPAGASLGFWPSG
jgi:hypothetical protein